MITDLQKIEAGLQAIGIAPAIAEVRRVFPWAQSVISAAISYLPPDAALESDAPKGLVARFARSSDYHTVLREKLEKVANAIMITHPTAQTKICVDTAPIPERKIAVLAGIATRGKNGNVFVENCGSYAALGEIITDIPVPELPVVQHDFVKCGSCTKCMEACPTGAIIAPGEIDLSRCISQLTQKSGIIPRELRKAMKNQIYGCDICQQSCPRNANIQPISPEFSENIFPGANPELLPLLNLTAQDFKSIKDSSIGWIRRTRLRRNAAIAAGNLRCTEATEALNARLKDENPTIRAHAAWALGEINSEQAIEYLKQSAKDEHDADVAKEIQAALANK